MVWGVTLEHGPVLIRWQQVGVAEEFPVEGKGRLPNKQPWLLLLLLLPEEELARERLVGRTGDSMRAVNSTSIECLALLGLLALRASSARHIKADDASRHEAC